MAPLVLLIPAALGAAFLLEQRDAPPDIIVTDVRMPGISGMQILESVRARAWDVPVILITAFSDPETRAQAKALGVTAFLEKPLDLEKLRQVIEVNVRPRLSEPIAQA